MNHLCIRELAEIVGGRLRLGCLPPLGGEHEPLGRMTTTSERTAQGDVFWGLATDQDNASWRAEEAFAHGALGAVVSGRRLEPWAGKFSLEVDDARAALWRLARAMRRRFTGSLVAVAGSGLEQAAGRAIRSVLRGRPEPLTQSHEQDAQAALALRLVELDEREQTSVVELRADTPGEVEQLAHFCCPHIGVLVGSGASSGFGTPRLWAESQVELLAALPESGFAVIDGDDPGLRKAVQHTAAQVVWFGGGPHCDVYASDIEWRGGGLSLVVDGQPLRLPACGREQVSAVLAAYAVGRVLGIPSRRIAAVLGRYRPATRESLNENIEEYALTT